jgi:hypothetical protein
VRAFVVQPLPKNTCALREDRVELPSSSAPRRSDYLLEKGRRYLRINHKDPDLDLGFVLPEKQEGKELPRFSPVRPGKAPVLRELDDVITLSRLPKAINRETYMELDQVSGIVRKPRTFYCCALESAPPFLLGSPAFSRDGSLAGFWLIHKGPSGQGSGLQGLLAMARTGPVVLPCADVMDVARQALKNPAGQSPQKTEDPKPESKDKPAESGKTEDSKTPER